MNRSLILGSLVAGLLAAPLAQAQNRISNSNKLEITPTSGGEGGLAGGTLNGPDVIVSSMAASTTNWGPVNVGGENYHGYSMTSVSCNLGEADAIWIASVNQHPVIGQNMYRLKGGRFEQIGQSWLKHGFCAADANGCGSPYEPNGSCDWLGTHATDTYSASRNGTQVYLGPRSEVNPWSGAYPYPYVKGWNLTGNNIYKRLQIRNSDIDPASNVGALYFADCQYICTDEVEGNRYNNVSYRQMLVQAFNGTTFPLVNSGGTITQTPAINAWRQNDPQVVLTNIDVPNDGRLILGYRVTDNGNGTWHYEYALYNMNSDRAVQSFAVPISNGVTVVGTGFHDVSYHSGETYSSVDWPVALGSTISWATQTFAQNVDANAIRWGTTYNFRFDSQFPPKCTTATIGLFKPGSPDSVQVSTVGPTSCSADVAPAGAADGTVNVTDLLAVIAAWGPCASVATCNCPADCAPAGGDDTVNVTDLLAVIAAWGPCP